MKWNFAIGILFCSFFIFNKNSFGRNYLNTTGNFCYSSNADSLNLPSCIAKLNKPGSKSIRFYSGGHKFQRIYTLEDGRVLYAFLSEASIGCNSNEPASTKYYNDSCKLVAKFPLKFSIKQAFKPFFANGFKPENFEESKRGDYVEYFANLKEQSNGKTEFNRVYDFLQNEKSFTIKKVFNDVLKFKVGDIVKADKKSGLRHYRNGKLINNYKIIPQLTTIRTQPQCRVAPCPPIETKTIVYYLETTKRFINFSFNALMMSVNAEEYPNTPNKSINIAWEKAYDLKIN
jgi:hypothetical protein